MARRPSSASGRWAGGRPQCARRAQGCRQQRMRARSRQRWARTVCWSSAAPPDAARAHRSRPGWRMLLLNGHWSIFLRLWAYAATFLLYLKDSGRNDNAAQAELHLEAMLHCTVLAMQTMRPDAEAVVLAPRRCRSLCWMRLSGTAAVLSATSCARSRAASPQWAWPRASHRLPWPAARVLPVDHTRLVFVEVC